MEGMDGAREKKYIFRGMKCGLALSVRSNWNATHLIYLTAVHNSQSSTKERKNNVIKTTLEKK